MKRLIIVAAALALAGCVSSSPSTPPSKQASAPAQKAKLISTQLGTIERRAVEAAVKAQLKDPYSAMFEGLIAFKQEGTRALHVCGFVNAKNSFGGYTGRQIFYVLSRYEPDGHFNTSDLFVTMDKTLTPIFAKDYCSP